MKHLQSQNIFMTHASHAVKYSFFLVLQTFFGNLLIMSGYYKYYLDDPYEYYHKYIIK